MRRLFANPAIMLVLLLLTTGLLWLFSVLRFVKDAAPALTALGILVGASWTLYQFVLRRSFETALSIDYVIDTRPIGDKFVVSLQVVLANIGNRRITAPGMLKAEEVADYENSVLYPCDLQIRTIVGPVDTPRFAGWWSTENQLLFAVPGIPEHISVLYEYTTADRKVDFFMEPGEKYNLGHVFVFPAGHYVAKVVFVGDRATAAEFWSRIIYFSVPTGPGAVL